jgi:1-acyl-sn-glycerol-3-phosphate acyltransferase
MKKKHPYLSNPLIGLYSVWTGFWFIGWFLVLFPFMLIFLQHKDTKRFAHRLVRIWSHLFFAFGFLRFEVVSEQKIDPKQVYVFCANHFSYLDIPAFVKILPNYFSFVGKSSIKKVPLFGYLYSRLNILVDRNDRASRSATLAKSIRALQSNRSIIIFPEGGITSKNFPYMSSPLKDGAFAMAIQQQVPILPVSFLNNHQLMDDDYIALKPGLIQVRVHAPIETLGLSQEDLPVLREKVFQKIQQPILDYHGVDMPQ